MAQRGPHPLCRGCRQSPRSCRGAAPASGLCGERAPGDTRSKHLTRVHWWAKYSLSPWGPLGKVGNTGTFYSQPGGPQSAGLSRKPNTGTSTRRTRCPEASTLGCSGTRVVTGRLESLKQNPSKRGPPSSWQPRCGLLRARGALCWTQGPWAATGRSRDPPGPQARGPEAHLKLTAPCSWAPSPPHPREASGGAPSVSAVSRGCGRGEGAGPPQAEARAARQISHLRCDERHKHSARPRSVPGTQPPGAR